MDLLELIFCLLCSCISKFAAIKVLLEFRKVANIPRKMLFVNVFALAFAFVCCRYLCAAVTSKLRGIEGHDISQESKREDFNLYRYIVSVSSMLNFTNLGKYCLILFAYYHKSVYHNFFYTRLEEKYYYY